VLAGVGGGEHGRAEVDQTHTDGHHPILRTPTPTRTGGSAAHREDAGVTSFITPPYPGRDPDPGGFYIRDPADQGGFYRTVMCPLECVCEQREVLYVLRGAQLVTLGVSPPHA